MKVLIVVAAFVALAVVQVTLAPRFEVAGAFPNLVLLAVVGVTRSRGVRTGLACACLGGVLLDLLSAGAVGPHAVALLAAAYTTGLWRGGDAGRLAPLVLAVNAALATLAYSAILVVMGPGLEIAVATRLTAAAALYNALLASLATAVVRRGRPARREPVLSLGTISRRAQA